MMSYNACIIKPSISHKYWCSLSPEKQEECAHFRSDKQGSCVYNSAPNGEYGDWCWSFSAARAAEDCETIAAGGNDGR